MQQTKFPGIFEHTVGKRRILLTKNLVKGRKVYDEYLVTENNIEYREWNAKKSKLCAAILKNINQIGIKENDIVLYLGASSGTTPRRRPSPWPSRSCSGFSSSALGSPGNDAFPCAQALGALDPARQAAAAADHTHP